MVKIYIITSKTNMVEENISQEFRLKKIDEKRNDFLEEIKLYYLVSFCYHWMCFSFCVCITDCYSYWY